MSEKSNLIIICVGIVSAAVVLSVLSLSISMAEQARHRYSSEKYKALQEWIKVNPGKSITVN